MGKCHLSIIICFHLIRSKSKGLSLSRILIRAFQRLGDNPKGAAILKVCTSMQGDPLHES